MCVSLPRRSAIMSDNEKTLGKDQICLRVFRLGLLV